ncbi:MAG: DNA primase [Ruminococcus sp.]|jgi:DNA primase|nr:DNA primase [Ruminococcus sp.]
MSIPKSFIEELKLRIPIESVIGSHVELRRAGKNMVGLCPFHSERTPSFSVNTAEQYYHCFGCGAGGNVITFVMNFERLEYIEAIKLLAERAGLSIPESDGREEQFAKLKSRILSANRDAAKFFHQNLAYNAEKAVRYLDSRGLSKATVVKYGIGYARQGWDSLTKHLTGLGYTEYELREARLSTGKEGNFFDFFRDRIMFPIIDLRGNVIGFGGRTIDTDGPKYINTPENPVFHKGRNLFSLGFAKKTNAESYILCEGYMDVIALAQGGFENAVATLGTALTPEQARLLAIYTKEVFISYDSDEAGRKAASRAINILSEAGLRTKILEIKNAKDPDEFIKKFGAAEFRVMLSKSGTATDFRLSKAEEGLDLNDNTDKVTYLDRAAKIIADLPEKHRIVYTSELADRLRVPLEQVRNIIEGYAGGVKKRAETERWQVIERQTLQVGKEETKRTRAEKRIWAYLHKNPEVGGVIADNLKEDSFTLDISRHIYNLLTKSLDENVEFHILSECDPAEQGKITEIMEIANSIVITEAEFYGNVKIIAEKPKTAAETTNDDLKDIFNFNKKKE